MVISRVSPLVSNVYYVGQTFILNQLTNFSFVFLLVCYQMILIMSNCIRKAGLWKVQWYGLVMRGDEEYAGNRVMRMDVGGGGERKRIQKRRWMDSMNVDVMEKGMSGAESHNGLCCQKH